VKLLSNQIKPRRQDTRGGSGHRPSPSPSASSLSSIPSLLSLMCLWHPPCEQWLAAVLGCAVSLGASLAVVVPVGVLVIVVPVVPLLLLLLSFLPSNPGPPSSLRGSGCSSSVSSTGAGFCCSWRVGPRSCAVVVVIVFVPCHASPCALLWSLAANTRDPPWSSGSQGWGRVLGCSSS
jgi:hypothetical protein